MKQPQPSALSLSVQSATKGVDQAQPRAPVGRQPRRHWRLILAGLVAFVVVGWSVLWLVAAQTTAGNLRDWVAQEQLLGRNWTCANRGLGGFPFRIELKCDAPSFQGAVNGADVTGRIGAVHAAAPIYAPTSIVVAVEGPLDISSSDGRSLHVAWTSLAIDLGFGSAGLHSTQIVADDLQIHGVMPLFDDFSVAARRVATQVNVDPGRPVDEAAYDFSFSLDEGKSSVLDSLFGDSDPATIEADGMISHLDAASGGDLKAAAEGWRQAGGRIDLTKTMLRKGASEIGASGRLDLDAVHRPRGQIDASGIGLDSILARYGIPRGALAIQGLLSGLLGSPGKSSIGAPNTLAFPLRIENGRVFVGPVRTPLILQPLY